MSSKTAKYPSHQKFIEVKCISGSEEKHYSMFCDDLPEDMIQAAMREVNETKESRALGLRSLKEFMKRKDLTCSDNEVLIAVLRNCKYDIKKSEVKLEKFIKLRKMVGNKLAKIDMKLIEAGIDFLAVGVLPYRDRHGRVIMFTQPIEEVLNYEMDLILIFMLACMLFYLTLPMTSLFGATYIADSDSSSMQIWYLLAKLYRHLVSNLANIPLRMARIKIIKENFFIRWCYNIIRPILPRKIANRVSFLGEGCENLHKHFHPDILPSEFGGNLGQLSNVYYRTKFLDFIQKLRDEYHYTNL